MPRFTSSPMSASQMRLILSKSRLVSAPTAFPKYTSALYCCMKREQVSCALMSVLSGFRVKFQTNCCNSAFDESSILFQEMHLSQE